MRVISRPLMPALLTSSNALAFLQTRPADNIESSLGRSRGLSRTLPALLRACLALNRKSDKESALFLWSQFISIQPKTLGFCLSNKTQQIGSWGSYLSPLPHLEQEEELPRRLQPQAQLSFSSFFSDPGATRAAFPSALSNTVCCGSCIF